MRNGIANSAVHPISEIRERTCQAAVPVQIEAPTRPPLLLASAWSKSTAAHATATLSFIGYLPVVLDARRVRAKDKSVLPVEIGVQDDSGSCRSP